MVKKKFMFWEDDWTGCGSLKQLFLDIIYESAAEDHFARNTDSSRMVPDIQKIDVGLGDEKNG